MKLVIKKGKHFYNLQEIENFDVQKNEHLSIKYFIDEEEQNSFFNSIYANRLMIESNKDTEIELILGKGYRAIKDQSFEKHFYRHNGWSGGDGIYSFNIDDGNDQFDQNSSKKTLFIFGDTFVGKSNEKTHQRYQPHLMPNNSYAYYEEDIMLFHINQKKDGSIKAFYQMDKTKDVSGTVTTQLIAYDPQNIKNNYLSSYSEDPIEIIFNFYKPRDITHIKISNYYQDEGDMLSKRGIKDIQILGSLDGKHYQLLKKHQLKQSKGYETFETLDINCHVKYIKLVGINQYNDETYKEGLLGLNKVKFYCHDKLYRDIEVVSNSIFSIEENHSWIWLQDGVVINDNLYFIPLIVNEDLTQPEGLQFKITGTSLFKTPMKNKKILPEERKQKNAPLMAHDGKSEYVYGAGIMAQTKQSGAKNPDGYIYIYGYKTTMGLRELIVARVQEENFEFFDDWTFYDGQKFCDDILKSAPILQHVSCELSVSHIQNGPFENKYIAVFTYDVNTPYVAIAIGDTPYGPFSKPQKVYKTKEKEIFKHTTYTYNAKAHPHLSKSDDILVSYNTNTYDFDHNMSNCLIYQPRFIRLKINH